MPSLKKIMSAICALAVVVSTTAVPVFADEETEADVAAAETVTEAADDVEPMSVNDIYQDFDALDAGALVSLGTVDTPPYTDIEGLTLYVGTRSTGAAADTNVSVETGGYGSDTSKALVINSANYTDANRGARIAINTPSGADEYGAKMMIKKNAAQTAYYGNDANTQGANEIPLNDEEWHELAIYVIGGERIFTLDGDIFASDTSTSMPVIWGTGRTGTGGKLYIDNFSCGLLTLEETAEFALSSINLSTDNDTVTATSDKDVYSVGGSFNIPLSVGTVGLRWSSDNEEILKVGRTDVTVASVAEATTAHLTVTAAGTNVTRTFTINVISDQNVVNMVAETLDILGTGDIANNGVSYDEATDTYEVLANFYVPVALSGATITWTADDSSLVVGGDGYVQIDASTEKSFTLSAEIVYGSAAVVKTFKIHIPLVRVFYDDDFDDWEAASIVAIYPAGMGHNDNYVGYDFNVPERSDGGGDNIKTYVQTSGDNHYVTFLASNYNANEQRRQYVNLTKLNGARITKNLYVSFDFMLSNSGSTMILTDGAANIELNSKFWDFTLNTWYNLEFVITPGESYSVTIRDANGNVLDKFSEKTTITKITQLSTAGENAVNHSIDNFYMATGTVATVKTEDISTIVDGTTQKIATVTGVADSDIEVNIDPADTTAFTYKVENGEVFVTAAADAADGTKATFIVTANSDIPVSDAVTLEAGSESYFASQAAEYIDITENNADVITAAGTNDNGESVYAVTGDLTVPETFMGADVKWSLGTHTVTDDKGNTTVVTDDDNGLVTFTDGKLVINPFEDAASTKVRVKATVNYNGSTTTKTFELDLAGYMETTKDIMTSAEAVSTIPYAADPLKTVVGFTAADGAVIMSDLAFPETTSVSAGGKTYSVDTSWTVAENDWINSKGVLTLSDMDAHDVKLTRTLTYKKNGTTLGSDTKTYDVKVQFKPEDVKAFVENAIYYNDDAYKRSDEYVKIFVYNYQVKFDKALKENFDGIPQYASKGSFDLPTAGLFGSKFTWYSSDTSVIRVADNNATAIVSTPTYTQTVRLTATISAESADTATQEVSVSVSGSRGASAGSGGGGGGGGTGGSTKKTVSGTVSGLPQTGMSVTPQGPATINPNPSGFSDLDSVPWAITAINNLYVNGVISGKTPTLFYPNDNITRAEFAKILVNAFQIETVSVDSATFSDVPTSHWASAFVETAYQKGIITGYENGAFDPDANVTRQDMAVMVMRAATAQGYSLEAVNEPVVFTDAADIAAYAVDAVETLQKAGIVNGVGEGAYEPLSTSTRAQACQMIYNVFN